ncbi:MAG: UDP-N-acetylglucosamine--N-acetylmuramyl-(pentapeptide) pyrophosphoryl-undecaprenol N-acetylglucosamine transferase, partial [Armatimonadota bacterium]|nr:UDP-N-acetylglucosamine--N-acetylmuramyl-(pentapeptide) pyrophosphoryl-undecaprenol N-acetylglucosamine transferase [Armatimonadota bacterium]
TGLGTAQALVILARLWPDVVVATGGYVCVPVGIAAAALGRPLVLQEQNMRPGLAHRLLSRWARWVSVPHPAAGARLGARRVEVTGVPVRRRALEGDRARGLARWGLDPGRFTLLVLGGSQGAESLNRAACQIADLLMFERHLQVLHQTGPEHVHWVAEAIGRREHVGPPAIRHVAVPFLDPIGDAYACADLVVCRAGAATLAEITAWGLPAILVPYPYAAEGHQEDNAAVLVAAGAAVSLADGALASGALLEVVRELIADRARREAMGRASRAIGRPEAAAVVADLVVRTAGGTVAQEALA